MAVRDTIVVGASAGGVEALMQLVRGLPPDLAASVFVVLHVPAHGTSMLPGLLSRKGPIPAVHAHDGQAIEAGRVYVAPPDFHMTIRGDRIRLSRGPRENGHRPAIDPLFRSAALERGRRAIGVILSGTLDDGTAGMEAIRRRGGLTVVQDPEEALYAGMIRSVLDGVAVDHCRPVAEIGPLLARLSREEVPDGDPTMSDEMEAESEMAEFSLDAIEGERDHPGTPSTFGCPDCGGTLWELTDGELTRFRCRVGHAWTALSLLDQQSQSVEAALWTGLRALEERASLCERIAARMKRGAGGRSVENFLAQARDARRSAAVLRRILIEQGSSGGGPAPGAGPAEGPEGSVTPDG
jgi:two-component system chemotaxis response regulator CheB